MPGVNALPMLLAQCDAVISLINNDYYDRAWCCVEVMMVQVLRRAYGLHQWYEQIDNSETDKQTTGTEIGANVQSLRESGNQYQQQGKRYTLRNARDVPIVMASKLLTYEEDRAKVLFLQRQSRLLG